MFRVVVNGFLKKQKQMSLCSFLTRFLFRCGSLIFQTCDFMCCSIILDLVGNCEGYSIWYMFGE
ncbi:hypothetical protein Hanom_Chr16g01511691 [Helianthus anomalus]